MSTKDQFSESINTAVDGLAGPKTPFIGIVCYKDSDGRIRAHSIGRLEGASIREVAELHTSMIEASEQSVLEAAESVDHEAALSFLEHVSEFRTEMKVLRLKS